MAEEERMTLAEERELLNRIGPDAMRAILNARSGIPTRITRAEVMAVDWFQGECSVRETGDPHIKEHVRWMPGCFLYVGELVWYLKFGNDGVVLGSSVGDKTESNGSGAKFAEESSVSASAVSNNVITYATPADGPFQDCYAEADEPILVTVEAMININNAGAFGCQISWRAVASGGAGAVDYGDQDMDGAETGSIEWVPASRGTLWHPNTTSNFELQFRIRCVNSVAGLIASAKYRRIRYQRMAQYSFDV